MRKVKWGVIGTATIAHDWVIPGIESSGNSEFYAIASRSREKLIPYENRCSKLYDSYDDLLKDPDIEAVYIPLPNNLHCEWTIKAAQHKKHILCEKPLAMTYDECVQMADAAKENNVFLMEGFMYRHAYKTKKICEIIKSGALGEIRFINSNLGFDIHNKNNIRLIKRTGGGALFDLGCYTINFMDMVMELNGASLVSWNADFATRKDIDGNNVDVGCNANLKYSNGALCSAASWFDSQPYSETRIVGHNGVLRIPFTYSDDPIPMTLSRYDFKNDPACQGKDIMQINPDYIINEEIKIERSDRYSLEVSELSRAVIEGTPPSFSIDASLRNMKVIESLYGGME